MTEFEKELKALLAKYRATIEYDFAMGADTHGLCDSGLALYVDGKLVRAFPYEASLAASDL